MDHKFFGTHECASHKHHKFPVVLRANHNAIWHVINTTFLGGNKITISVRARFLTSAFLTKHKAPTQQITVSTKYRHYMGSSGEINVAEQTYWKLFAVNDACSGPLITWLFYYWLSYLVARLMMKLHLVFVSFVSSRFFCLL